uniref:Uncharacterized protein n=1 Tax=Anopheles minimus TaxID=112268 RepID=A0A182WMZ3_9DIPT
MDGDIVLANCQNRISRSRPSLSVMRITFGEGKLIPRNGNELFSSN